MKTALEQNREDQALGAAWRRCEAALPVTSAMYLIREGDLIRAEFMTYGEATEPYRPTTVHHRSFDGDTPTEALTALAEALEARRE